MAENPKAAPAPAAAERRMPHQDTETGTPATPGGGPEPESPTHRLSVPSTGPAGEFLVTPVAADPPAPDPTLSSAVGSSGGVVESGEEFTDRPVVHRHEVEQGESERTLQARDGGPQ